MSGNLEFGLHDASVASVGEAAAEQGQQKGEGDHSPLLHESNEALLGDNGPAREGELLAKPKRPLSAYNRFFHDERERLLKTRSERQTSMATNPGGKAHGKIGFSGLAKTIATKWKIIDADLKVYYETQAEAGRRVYNEKADAWREQQKSLGLSTKMNNKKNKRNKKLPPMQPTNVETIHRPVSADSSLTGPTTSVVGFSMHEHAQYFSQFPTEWAPVTDGIGLTRNIPSQADTFEPIAAFPDDEDRSPMLQHFPPHLANNQHFGGGNHVTHQNFRDTVTVLEHQQYPRAGDVWQPDTVPQTLRSATAAQFHLPQDHCNPEQRSLQDPSLHGLAQKLGPECLAIFLSACWSQ
jgi:hypothetical protein